VTGRTGPTPDRSHSRFFCNRPRQVSLLCGVVAVAALVVGAAFAEISASGAPTSLQTAIVRAVIVGSLVIGVIFYVIGGRMRAATGRSGQDWRDGKRR
jgi:predicted cobalt transporter CbtA